MPAISDVLSLEAGALTLDLVPLLGGSVASFRIGTKDIMRPLSDADRVAGRVLGVAMFPMVPYANRIAGNTFTFRDATYTVVANNPPERLNVHGTAWQLPWTVESASASEARLTLDVRASEEPYSYHACQHFVLDPSGLTVTTTITNRGDAAMPFGFGLHPWFERSPDVTVQFNASRFYLEEPEGVSGDPIYVPPELDFSGARRLPSGWRNNNYGGWFGVAQLRWQQRGLALRMSADRLFQHLMLYADPSKPFFCVEPQTNASGAFNRPGGFEDPREGVIVLQWDESAEGSVRFEPTLL